MNFVNKTAVFLATGGTVGYIPFAPGTFGSLIGLAFIYLLADIQLWAAVLVAVGLIFFAIWISGAAAKTLKRKDPGCIVIDEIAGMVVTFIGLPFTLTTVIPGFVLFRILDISKPFPIRMLDQRLSGGLGIVADDVVAGIFANLIIRVSLAILNIT
jgi:phosphatidylglycerophosphatase A